jgi:hypothetical protein
MDRNGEPTGPRLSRREWLRATLRLSLTGALVAALTGCQKRQSGVCSDPNRLSDSENSLRASLHYTEQSPRSDQMCRSCGFFDAPAGNACGTCKLLKGAVNPMGHCDSWSKAMQGNSS